MHPVVPRRPSPQLLTLLLILAVVAAGALLYASLVTSRQSSAQPGAVLSADPAVLRLLLVVGVVALAFTAAWQIRRRLQIAAAIRTLAMTADRLRRGDVHVRSGLTDAPDDLGLLARSLDEIAEAMQRQLGEETAADIAGRLSGPLAAAILQSDPDAVVLIDHLGRIVEFNHAAERLFDYARDDVLDRPMAELIIPPLLRHRHQRAFGRYMSTGESTILDQRVQFSAMRADGSEFPVELTVSRLVNAGPPLFVGFIHDISEHKARKPRCGKAKNACA